MFFTRATVISATSTNILTCGKVNVSNRMETGAIFHTNDVRYISFTRRQNACVRIKNSNSLFMFADK